MAGYVHDFVIVIPVADRPEHLGDCLDSLAELLRRYPYAGRVEVLIADDSLDPGNRTRHEKIACARTTGGLRVHYLGQDEQRRLVESLSPGLRVRLVGVLGDGRDYSRKGASITRNIAYLWLNRQHADGRRRLYWFLDSDQEFRVNVATATGEDQPYAIDYLGDLDRLFATAPTRILTGKVVGDPPVSPAVMAGTFLDDVLAFLSEMARLEPAAACTFHGAGRGADDAAYHDMAELFGFKTETEAFRHRCPVRGEHDHAACFAEFAERLSRFFDGEHPTRRAYYRPDDPMAGVKPARTVYTGNYVVTSEALEWFIPFADLRLRMAGPTLGRLVRAGLGEAFVSANLPMLHRRTQGDTGRSECRPGVERALAGVDLSGEFERQYYGDVMLFSVELLAENGFPDKEPDAGAIPATVREVEADLRARYHAKLVSSADKLEGLAQAFDAPSAWWRHDASLEAARQAFQRFIDDMRENFGPDCPAWRRIESAQRRDARLAAIVAAIAGYRDARAAWRQALKEPAA